MRGVQQVRARARLLLDRRVRRLCSPRQRRQLLGRLLCDALQLAEPVLATGGIECVCAFGSVATYLACLHVQVHAGKLASHRCITAVRGTLHQGARRLAHLVCGEAAARLGRRRLERRRTRLERGACLPKQGHLLLRAGGCGLERGHLCH